MREITFVQKNQDKWTRFEKNVSDNADELADAFIELTDDLSYARTFYPESNTERYLNQLAGKYYLYLYKNKKQPASRFITFWKKELPQLFYGAHRQLLTAFVIFMISALIGAFSASKDENFVRLILGDSYVNMTIENIRKGDPMAVYKGVNESSMFVYIMYNNIRVSFLAFVFGIFFSMGTVMVLFQNGVMLGAFQYFFFQYGVLTESLLTIWIHGTLEISAIVIAGCAGLVMGNSILFPGTYSRSESFSRGVRRGMKIVAGLVPVFIIAAFFESYVTRHTEMPVWMSLTIIGSSLAFIIFYFIIYPIRLNQTNTHEL
ncbi:MAG: stage II sporulation protein M [Bacteroidales bacterium]|jgi:uncharacterized membrane protein SpoIIM required for sporulation|nr:stage II sporulation protein M [Bacteroidales bacterium]